MIRAERSSSRSAGFTLVEALIVVALMGILALFSMPALFNFIERSKLEGAVRQAASQVQLARLDAIKTGGVTTVQMDVPQRMIRVTRADGRQISTMTLPNGISFGTLAYTAEMQPNGSAGPVGMVLAPDDGFLFQSDRNTDNRMRVRIEPLATARTVIQKYDKDLDAYFEAPWKWY
jgi:prepilin-type N-terminal cleavage/methylation domain-containing protein